MHKRPRLIGELLGSGPLLRHLARRAKAVLALADRIREILPPELACHITGAECRQRELVALVDSAAFRMRVQLELARLREALASEIGEPIETVSVRVQPPR